MRRGAPLRFLALVVAGWAFARGTMLMPDWWRVPAAPAAVVEAAALPPPAAPLARAEAPPVVDAAPEPLSTSLAWVPPRRSAAAVPLPPALAPEAAAAPLLASAFALPAQRWPARQVAPGRTPAPPLREARAVRWSGSAWLFGRSGEAAALAPSGTLGGSQAGGRFLYRLNGDASRPLSLSARLSAPLGDEGAEAAAGIEWRPSAALPLHLLAERRQALDPGGRSDFALTLHGGVFERPLPGGVLLDAYAQAGVVGASSRDLFADAALKLSVPVEGLRIGPGLWAAAQPDLARLDAGPQVSMRLPVAGNVRLSADWRFRIAGDAAPASGPSITLATDF